MGLLDNLKAKLAPAKGKYSDKIHTGTDKAKGAMDRLAHKDEPPAGGGDTFTPPNPPPPAS